MCCVSPRPIACASFRRKRLTGSVAPRLHFLLEVEVPPSLPADPPLWRENSR